ncbi:hypothetical protein PR202_ga00363 [Eleusine coracana subsp. coracana]|uniref:Protein kinase domain-containing protein n=1 Tax=Eleusine coracana subsp. coracana TaxID=191504 RepID=A0AAV5BGB4_ELECO|nr:hypothetical protein PR202_ga00363 [Eleusine coracana subsp. coracana]
MGWTEAIMAALFGDGGGALGYLRLSRNNSSAASSVDPSALLDNSSAGVAVDDVLEVTLHELKKATRSFSEKMLIGEGRYAKVYKASLPSGMTVAAKRLGTPSVQRRKASDVAFLMRQVSAAARLRHENVVQLLGYCLTADLHVLLYEYADVGTLHDALHGTKISYIALDAAKGLAYLHEAGVTYRDVRSTNVLLFQGFRAKIGDYDLFKQLPEKDVENGYAIHATRAAHGLCVMGLVTQKSDVYSFGIVLVELLTGIKPTDPAFVEALSRGTVPRIDPKLGREYPGDAATKLAMIALWCLKHKSASRPSMATVVTEIKEGVQRAVSSVECWNMHVKTHFFFPPTRFLRASMAKIRCRSQQEGMKHSATRRRPPWIVAMSVYLKPVRPARTCLKEKNGVLKKHDNGARSIYPSLLPATAQGNGS